jgi:hypothetical protein
MLEPPADCHRPAVWKVAQLSSLLEICPKCSGMTNDGLLKTQTAGHNVSAKLLLTLKLKQANRAVEVDKRKGKL